MTDRQAVLKHPSDAVSAQAVPDRPFLFVGNGPYRNRGCEAIVRGTMEILSTTFGPDLRVRAGVMASPATVASQQAAELDARVANFAISHVGRRFGPKWWASQANSRLGTNFQAHVRDLAGPARGVRCALQLGGDNYSLDYGRPWKYIAIDRWLAKHGVPVVVWGASVGPFEADPEFAPHVLAHLKTLAGIFVRETASRDYLARQGITNNVHLVADPAFRMAPCQPQIAAVRDLVMEGMVGINISPLVARFSQAGGLEGWSGQAADMIAAAASRAGRPVLLIPHVGSPRHDEDDFAFMAALRDRVASRVQLPIKVAPAGLGAAELKWLIERCAVFAGARTHATIAALSTGVPTLSISYSIKAVGINQDIYGTQEFCLPVSTITADHFAQSIAGMLAKEGNIRTFLAAKIPEVRNRAQTAGAILARIMEARRQ